MPKSLVPRGATPGDLISFGRFPHSADGSDLSPILWRVLENSGSDLLLLSERLLDCRRYHRDFVDTSWQDCDLRHWLNHDFSASAFNPAEKRLIKTTPCPNNGQGSPDTKDKVFLFNMDEMRALKARLDESALDPNLRAIGTDFAYVKKADGCRLFAYQGSIAAGYLTEGGQKLGVSWWWLRDQPKSPSRAAFVGVYGSLRGYCRVNRTSYGVRPALRVRFD